MFLSIARRASGLVGLFAIVLLVPAAPAAAQQQPTPAATSMAKEIIDLKGSMGIFPSIIAGVVQQARDTFLQTNLTLEKPLNETAAQLRTELAARVNDVRELFAKLYAQRFSEQELKEILTFLKSPTGKKFISEEPIFLNESLSRAEQWSTALSDEVMGKFRAEMRKKGHNL
ncbi:MAG: DUF2059 domain-containing protein [Pseudorhodoplanes sp.]